MPSFSLEDHAAAVDWIEENVKRASRKAVLSAAFRLLQHIVTEIIPRENPPPVDRGQYRAAWRVVPTEKGADLVNNSPQAPVIEFGARAENIKPGRAMIDALTEWARRKGLGNGGTDPHRGVAWAIAKTMRGTARIAGKGIFNRKAGQGGLRIAERAEKMAARFMQEELARELKW